MTTTTTDICRWLVQRIHELRGVALETIDTRERFTRLGLDSLLVTRVLADLSKELGRSLPPTLAWEYSTIESLARYLTEGADSVASVVSTVPERARGTSDEPIAIIGMACRFPGAPNIEAFWKLLCEGRDAITEVPKDRWNDAVYDALGATEAERTAMRRGGFLESIDGFDPQFFGISPREAIQMDPQQRLMLELCWEAFDDAGIAQQSLKGSRTGVFAATIWSDYAALGNGAGAETIAQHTVTGTHHSIIANRISYYWGLQGPSFTLDSACSSGLVTMHLACDSLRRGESTLAVAGAVNLNIVAESALAVARFGALSPDGICHTFDARANGYVRGEGGGIVILKKLSRAIADGDPIYCLIRGSSVNNDGPSNGMTAPNPKAQEALLYEAYQNAGINPVNVQYVEAHGTGTALGDPIEAKALGAMFGKGRTDETRLLVGSAKTNVGHLEGAAGIVGVIKAALSVKRRLIPASLHFDTPNPHIDLAQLHIEVPTSLRAWPRPERRLLAGVSSFGLGGTNAHVVLEEWPSIAPATTGPRSQSVDSQRMDISRGVVFVFPGQGAQWYGMVRVLLQGEPVFRTTIEDCDRLVYQYMGFSLIDELIANPEQSHLDRIEVSLPLIISIDIAIARLWISWGIEPSAVVGHSTGEIAAAHICGALDLDDTMRVICAYGRMIARFSGQGAMALCEIPWTQAVDMASAFEGRVYPAIQDSVTTTVMAGEPAELDRFLSVLQEKGITSRRVAMNVAPHCPLVDAVRADLFRSIEQIRPRRSKVPLISEVTGVEIAGDSLDAAHWVKNFGDPAFFSRAIDTLIGRGHRVFLDMGPHPITRYSVETNLRHANVLGVVLGSLHRNEDERQTLSKAITVLETMGFPIGLQSNEKPWCLPLSAKTPEALVAMAKSYQEWFATTDAPLHQVAYTASLRRSHLEHRLSVVGSTKEEIAAALGAFAAGEMPPGIVTAKAAQSAPKVVFVFPGQGSQWVGMGRQLYQKEPAFRDALAACDEAIRKEAGFSVIEELDKPEETSRLHETIVAQPALFAIEVSLSALLQSWGIVPSAVIGHSVGEIAAAYVAGMLDLPQAARLVTIRARVMQKATGHGKMVSIRLTEGDARNALAGYEDRVGIAAVNDPGSVVLSGDVDAVDAIVERLSGNGVETRALRVNYAFHSPQMDPLVAEFIAAMGALDTKPATIPMISTVTATPIADKPLDVTYWAQNIRQTVRFAEAITWNVSNEHCVFVEVGPHPVLALSMEQTLTAKNIEGKVLSTLRRDKDERKNALMALGALHTFGVPVDWKRLHSESGKVVELPTHPWQRERYWVESPTPKESSTKSFVAANSHGSEHPLLGLPFTSSLHPEARFWQQSLSVAAIPWLAEHRVQGEVVFPGAGYVELALAAAAKTFGGDGLVLEDVAFEQMLVIGKEQLRNVQVVLIDDGDRKLFKISSQSEDTLWTLHASGTIRLSDKRLDERIEEPKAIADRLANVVDIIAYYQTIRNRQMFHGPPFQGIVELRTGGHEALGKIRLPDDVRDDGYAFHPALLDACIQVSLALFGDTSESYTYVPVGFDRLQLHRRPARELWVFATKSVNAETTCDLRIVDETGVLFAAMDGLRLQRIDGQSRSTSDALEGCVYEVDWTAVDVVPEPKWRTNGTWVVVSDRGGMNEALNERFVAKGQRCVRVVLGSSYEYVAPDEIRVDSSNPEDYRRFFKETFGEDGRCDGIVHLASLDVSPFDQTTVGSLTTDLARASVTATYLIQAIVRHGFRDAPRLFLITRGAQSVNATDPVSVSQAPILGLGKTITMEHPELRCTRIDLTAEASENDTDLLWRELGSKDREEQIALRGQSRYVARLEQGQFELEDTDERNQAFEPARGRPYRLEIRNPGALDRLALHEMAMPQPGPGEVLIEVEAAGLNFLDVLAALAALPAEATGTNECGPMLGGECAGRITAVGDGVTDLEPGQEVIALGAQAFGTYMVSRSVHVVRKPPKLSCQQAATIPLVFLTAYYALEYVGRLRAGERVLIHAGAGGVGLAAIQWAQHVGAEIFATAGSEEKRKYLRELGVTHVFDSRTLQFVDDIKRITGGDGVDVVLNSLSGEFIPASLSLLRDYGRFLEIGKRDYFENKQIGLRPFLRNLSFSLVDLRGLLLQRPERIAELLREVFALFERGDLRALPVQTFPIAAAAEAFQYMAQAKHIGKIALTMKDVDAKIVPLERNRATSIRADRTYLITGGLGGLGLSLAKWLVEQGARSLMLVGRKGPSDEARLEMATMEQAGAHVHCAQVDVSRESEVENLFATIRNEMLPLGGIVHAAMVLDDHTLLEQSEESFQKVFAPKALGAWNLHKYSDGKDLDFFVTYSSVAALVGSPGQGNYCASNAFLDALCRERARLGLPAMSIQWGPFADVGAAANRDDRGKRLSRRGMMSLSPAEGLDALRRLLRRPRPEVGIFHFDPRQWAEFYPSVRESSFFQALLERALDGKELPGAQTPELRTRILHACHDEALALVEQFLARELGHVLQLNQSRIQRDMSLHHLGLDSLMRLELRNRIRAGIGFEPPMVALSRYDSVEALASFLFKQVSVTRVVNDVHGQAPISSTDEEIETVTF